MVSIDDLKSYSKKLEFTMKEEEFETLKGEFDILLKQVELIDKIDGLSGYAPIYFPFSLDSSYLREDEVSMELYRVDAFKNCNDVLDNQVKLPKVVG